MARRASFGACAASRAFQLRIVPARPASEPHRAPCQEEAYSLPRVVEPRGWLGVPLEAASGGYGFVPAQRAPSNEKVGRERNCLSVTDGSKDKCGDTATMRAVNESSESFLDGETGFSTEGPVNCRAGKENRLRSAVGDTCLLPPSFELKSPSPAGRASGPDRCVFDALVFHLTKQVAQGN